MHIQPGRLVQNGHVESLHGRPRDECLNASWLRTLNDVRWPLDNYRQEYNYEWLHSSHTGRPLSLDEPWAMEIWREFGASHIPIAPTTTAARYTRPQTLTEKLRL